MADTELDTRGLQCPLPVLKARKTLKSLQSGDKLTILATDPMAAVDVPHFCNETGHLYHGRENRGKDVTAYIIEKI